MATAPSTLTEVRLTGHTKEQEYTLATITPEDFCKQHAGSATDFATMCNDFKALCPDFGRKLDYTQKYYSVDYCGKVLYEIGPMSRRVKAGQADKYYDIIMPDGEHAFIATYKSGSQYEYKATANYISLSVKQASLLAMTVLDDIIEVLPEDKMVLTPLAGAIFSKECMHEIAAERGMRLKDVAKMINSSCQGGGQYLQNANGSIAVVAAWAASKNVQAKQARTQIVSKVYRQYAAQNKKPDLDACKFFARYATGGMPSDFSISSLDKIFSEEQDRYAMTLRERARIVATSTAASSAIAPVTTSQDMRQAGLGAIPRTQQ